MARTTGAKHKLSNVKLDEISFVGKGDNPEAHIILLKNHPSIILSLGKNYKGKDKADVLKKHFEESKNIQKGDGDAKLFQDIVDDKVIRDKLWNLVWILEDSISSISYDDECTNKQEMIEQSVSQFKDAVSQLTGGNTVTKEELEKALEVEKAKSADLEKQLADVKKEKEDLEKAKPAPGEVCKACGQKMPEVKKEEIDKSALPEAVVKQLEEIEKEAKLNKEKIEKLEDEAITKECIEKGKTVSAIGKAEVVGDIFKQASKVSKEFAESIYNIFKTADARIKESGLFKEVGGSDGGEELTAIDRLNKAAEEHRKANPTLTKEQAWDFVYKNNTELRKAYQEESRK